MLMGESAVENQTNTPLNQPNRQQNNRDGKIPGAIFLSRKDLVQVNDLNLYLEFSARLHRLVSEATEAQAVLRWNHFCRSYPPKWPLAIFLNLYFPHSSSGPSQKLRWRDSKSCPLPNPSILLESKFSPSHLFCLYVTPTSKVQTLSIIPLHYHNSSSPSVWLALNSAFSTMSL